ncbi:T9SS type A sorting domain-containing protein [Hymenobacter sp. RP-2-7]|uniref:Aminopeptidase N n=1 Tax=Hymenobacter polaris TaxID=2682546 RepID=A0A7Y0ABV8_9BACT|nr:M1 family aminopeptidase [Hymenobacter polaris]NML64489.1 T9SS type A sorting domain-containing protein [Hymenobacter polaris]
MQKFTFFILGLLGWLAAPAGAQRVGFDPAGADALGCYQARVAGAQRLAAAATVPLRHRQKMDRYDVQWYKLDLTLANTSLGVAGSGLLRVRVRQALDSVAFELYQAPAGAAAGAPTLLIDSVVAGGRRSPGILRQGQAVTAALAQPAPAGAVLDVRVYYHGTAPYAGPAAPGAGNGLRHYNAYGLGGTSYPYQVTASLTEPFFAHEWFPCKQVLTDKADSAAVSVTTAATNKVGSNGLLRRTVALPGGQVRYEWSTRHPIDYYLISVAVAPYVEALSYANPAGGPRVPVLDYLYDQRTLDYYQSQLALTPGFIENYSRLVGTYFFADEKYGHALAPIGGGMEHQTMTTQDGFTFTLNAHELFHQWFGDNVTCASWQDIWLNEAFASYGEYLSLQAFDTPAAARAWMDDAQARAHLDNTGTVLVPDTTSADRIFNYNLTYKKGAAVVHLLRYLCQDDARFFRVLRTYQQQYSGSTARTADLQRLFEAELGTPLDYFFAQWYRGQGYPSLAVRWNQAGSTLALQVTETVTTPAATPFFRTDVEYQLTFADGSQQLLRLPQTQATQTYTVPVGGAVQSIVVDPSGWLPDLPGPVQHDATLVLATRPAQVTTLGAYPNPCREQLKISDLPASIVAAEVYDALGRLVLRQPLGAAPPVLVTASLAPGLYVLRLLSADGAELGRLRFARAE